MAYQGKTSPIFYRRGKAAYSEVIGIGGEKGIGSFFFASGQGIIIKNSRDRTGSISREKSAALRLQNGGGGIETKFGKRIIGRVCRDARRRPVEAPARAMKRLVY